MAEAPTISIGMTPECEEAIRLRIQHLADQGLDSGDCDQWIADHTELWQRDDDVFVLDLQGYMRG